MEKYLRLLSKGDRIGLTLIRLSIAIVFIWIGLLKFVPYEADSITPFVANSPVMSFFYEHPEEYKQHLTHEGEFKPQEREWQKANNTYTFSNGLGVVEVLIALLVLANPVSRWLGLIGDATGRFAPRFSVLVRSRASGVERHINAGGSGDDHRRFIAINY